MWIFFFFSSRRRHTRCALVTGVQTCALPICINPNVDAHTHQYITTGLDENKFGIAHWELTGAIETLRRCQRIELVGIHFHIGSQITDLNVFKSLCVKVNELNNWFDERGFRLKVLNVGRSEEHTSELQSLMRISYAVFCLKKKNKKK